MEQAKGVSISVSQIPMNSNTTEKNWLARHLSDKLELAGVTINGSRPWDIQVRNPKFYLKASSMGSLGFGETYMDGWWDCEDLEELFYLVLRCHLDRKFHYAPAMWLSSLRSRAFNLQTRLQSRLLVKRHYDLGNDLYASFLDPYNQYTCGYFEGTDSLDVAQEKKLDLMCRKLQLSSKDHVLDIGCGWGGFAKFAAQNYGCRVTGISLSDEQIAYAREFCRGLPVEIRKCDYRDLQGKFDKILVCGMIEHVGFKNYRTLMAKVNECLSDSGLFLLHTIGNNTATVSVDPWIAKYIFTNSVIPSLSQLTEAFEGLFVLEDWHSFGPHYIPTLRAWAENFRKNWPRLQSKYSERFRRMWLYYLLSCAGAFRARELQLWQFLFSKDGKMGGFASVR